MTGPGVIEPGVSAAQTYGPARGGGQTANLGDILERVLDKGLVIAGDIRVNLLDIELLTIKLRLVIASLETAREVGINWWEADPWLSAGAGRDKDLVAENRRLRDRVGELESGDGARAVSRPRRASRRSRDHEPEATGHG
jgi:hypothetical protein